MQTIFKVIDLSQKITWEIHQPLHRYQVQQLINLKKANLSFDKACESIEDAMKYMGLTYCEDGALVKEMYTPILRDLYNYIDTSNVIIEEIRIG